MTPPETAAPPPPAGKLDSTDWKILAALLAFFALARVPTFFFAENLYGDAVVRSELAERWARSPTFYRSFTDGVYQFGPLHFYYMGLLLKAWPSREDATRFGSLLMGLLLVVPAYRIGRRLFSRKAAVATALALGAWSLHIQASTTAASEAFFLTLFFLALDFLFQGTEERRFGPMAVAALLTNLFCALRYDGWMYAPLLVAVVALGPGDRIAALTRAALFAAFCSPWPLWWTQMSERTTGDPLYALHYIDAFHARWVGDGVAWLGTTGHRVASLLFWPGTLLATASLLVGAFALAGLVLALVRRERRALALLALVPAAYYAFRGAVLLDFSPLARFFMVQVALALFYVEPGFRALCGRLPSGAQRAVVALAAALALATPLWLGWATAWKTGTRADLLRPISPLSTMPVDQMATARFLKAQVGPEDLVVLDEAPQFVDINVGFFTGLPEPRLARRRWDNFDKQLSERPKARWLFLAKGGALESTEKILPGAERLTWRGDEWAKAFAVSEALFVYRRD